MIRIFITGDRQFPHVPATVAAAQLLGQIAADHSVNGNGEPLQLVTGDNVGLEQAFRLVAEGIQLPVEVIATPEPDPETGKPDWDKRHMEVELTCDKVFMLHTAPSASSIGKSLARVVSEDKIVVPAIG